MSEQREPFTPPEDWIERASAALVPLLRELFDSWADELGEQRVAVQAATEALDEFSADPSGGGDHMIFSDADDFDYEDFQADRQLAKSSLDALAQDLADAGLPDLQRTLAAGREAAARDPRFAPERLEHMSMLELMELLMQVVHE